MFTCKVDEGAIQLIIYVGVGLCKNVGSPHVTSIHNALHMPTQCTVSHVASIML
jgi:hypothetical protein